MKTGLAIIGGVCAFAILIAALQFAGFASFSFYAPKYEGVRRDVMIESRAYSEATTRQMYRLKLQWQQAATPDEKATIRAMALHEARAFDIQRLPADLQLFITQLGG